MDIYPSQETYGIRIGIIYEENDTIKTNNIFLLHYDKLTNSIKKQINDFYNKNKNKYNIVPINELHDFSNNNDNYLLVELLHKCSCSLEVSADYYQWFQITEAQFIEIFL